jgi:hypothetical protein
VQRERSFIDVSTMSNIDVDNRATGQNVKFFNELICKKSLQYLWFVAIRAIFGAIPTSVTVQNLLISCTLHACVTWIFPVLSATCAKRLAQTCTGASEAQLPLMEYPMEYPSVPRTPRAESTALSDANPPSLWQHTLPRVSGISQIMLFAWGMFDSFIAV